MRVGMMSFSLSRPLRAGGGGGDKDNLEAGEYLGVTKPVLNSATATRGGKCRGRTATLSSKVGESCRRKGLEESFSRIWRASWGGCFSLDGMGNVDVAVSFSVLGSVSSSVVTAFLRVKG